MIRKAIRKMALGIVLGIVPLTGGAQTAVPSFKSPLWISGSSIRQAESHNQGTCTVRLLKDEPVTVTSEFPWVTPSVDGQDITLTYTGNQAAGWRNSRIYIKRASETGNATLVFGQPGHPLTQEATEGHTLVRPAAASDNTHQGSSDVSLTLDDNPATIYHSSWNGFDPADETAWPVLVYDFNKPQLIDFINYIPRSGGGNGSFGLVDIYYRTNGAADYVLMGQYDLGMGSSPSRIPTVNGAGVNVESFKFVVRTGACNDKQGKCYASCAEMQFLAAGRDWTRTVPSGAEANSAQPGREIEKSFDNDIGTNWHTAWGSNRFTVSESNPAVITYHFNTPQYIRAVNYLPQQGEATSQNGKANGRFGLVDISYRQGGENIRLGSFDFGENGDSTKIYFGKNGTEGITDISFSVKSGYGGFAHCAEMWFYTSAPFSEAAPDPDYEKFSSPLLTELKPGTTQADVDDIKDPFLRELAQQMLDGTYSSEGRVSSHEPLKSVQDLSAEWKTPGKFYDQVQGATGIMVGKGKIVVACEGIPDDRLGMELRVIGWTVPEGEYFRSESFTLHNGLNVLEKTSDWNGLAYVCNYNTAGLGTAGDIKVHIINGSVNGILTPDKTNEELQRILDNSCYSTIDLMGERVHSVWEVNALKTYTKGQYVRYINVLDQLIKWEHELVGFEKYGLVPKNKTMAYVNYNYYMYQGGFGVTFKYDTQNLVCNPDVLIAGHPGSNDDMIWGLSHEWGHQHQMHPYFSWGGLGEVSNNMNSAYNVLHMGYYDSAGRIRGGRITFLNNCFATEQSDRMNGTVSGNRRRAYENSRQANTVFRFPKLKAVAKEMSDSVITALTDHGNGVTVNPDKAVSVHELDVIGTFNAFFMLHNYMSETLKDTDFTPDLYEMLRSTEEGTRAFPDGWNDKYALLAAAQNGVTGKAASFKEKYPASAWADCIDEKSNRFENTVPFILNYARKASIRAGINLYPYFEQWGFFRTIAMYIDDYGNYGYALTKEMQEEFKADMEALNLKTLSAEDIENIANTEYPTYPVPEFSNEPKTAQ